MQGNSRIRRALVIQSRTGLILSKGHPWWCQPSRFRLIGVVDKAIAIRLMYGPSVLSCTKCSRVCSSSTSRRRQPIRWLFNYSIAKSRREPGRGLKTLKSLFSASNSFVRLCSLTLLSDPRGKRWHSMLSSRHRSLSRSLWTSSSTKSPLRD